MLERDMEDLIASFPEDFFPGHQFVLKGRQQAFAGIGRFDLLFTDRYHSNVLMELKAVSAKYENATQLAKYKEALESRGEQNILMWLVALAIPSTVREFLDRIGIEYTEIHEPQFRRVADRRGVVTEIPMPTPASGEGCEVAKSNGRNEQEKLCNNGPAMLSFIDKQQLERLIRNFESVVKRKIDKSLAVKLRTEILEADSPRMRRETMLQLARWCKTDGIYSDGMMVAQKISETLFGSILNREHLRT